MNENLFFIHSNPLETEFRNRFLLQEDRCERDMRRELSERVMFCVMANLGYELEFKII
jgi:hypothetical protein